MSYIGVQPTAGQYRKLDDISGSFNGSTTTFTTQVGSQNVSAGTAQQLLVSLGGVIQNPITDYTVSTNSITFTTAPAAGLSFFAVLMGEAVNTGTPSDGVVTGAKLSAPFNYNSGLLYLDSSNNRVGISTTSVTGKLSIDGSALNPISSLNTASNYAIALYGGSATGAGNGIAFCNDNGTAVGGAIVHIDQGSNNLGDLAFYTAATANSPTERARIDSSGRLLVGTPSSLTTKYVTSGFEPGLQNAATSGTGGFFRYSADPDGPAFVLSKSRNTSTGSHTVVNSGDTVGYIGFAGSDGTDFETAATIKAEVDGTPGNNDMPGRLVFSTTADGASSPTERMRISANGQLTHEAPVTPTQIFQNTNNVSGDGTLRSLIGSNCNNTASYHFRGNTDAVNNWYLYGNGTTSYSSDERLKKNIETTRDGYLEDLCQLRVVKYNWKNQDEGSPKELGLIAQEVEQVFPGLVQDDLAPVSDEDQTIYKQLKGSVLPVILLKALQEAAEKIEALEARLSALESA